MSRERLESLLAEYVARQAEGNPPDPAVLCVDDPDLLEPLKELVGELEAAADRADRGDAPSLVAALLSERSEDSPDAGEAEATGMATMSWSDPTEGIAPGRTLAGRYRIIEPLGRGGLGEVWRAMDVKLRVEVALKALRRELVGNPRGLELVRGEVRAAREVLSPNVCRIFDLVEAEGEELVSMEYVDGETLLDLLRERGPLELDEAMEIASQFLAGLTAVHEAGLVHRDVKPENVMVTRTGRVVVMDLGLAKAATETGGGSISGTPAYMAPEQAAGDAVDTRADVFSAGVMLAEMVSPEGVADRASRRSLWEAVRQQPPRVPDTPWQAALARAVARDPADRYSTAMALARALEKVTLRASSVGDVSPYPGLASFTEADADYFFGREAEVEGLWKKLQQAPRLLAVVGASGAGKSSFLRAGVLSVRPDDWRSMLVKPGASPLVTLGQTVAREMSGDRGIAEQMVRFSETEVAVDVLARWRRSSTAALLVIDQFEELFTQCLPEVRRTFAELLGRLPLEADVHVLLGMRDDFLVHCHDHEALQPALSELTVLAAPKGQALRRAIVQPALKCGYRFEDEALVDEMLAEIEGERGALPLLAFAAASLWERRDRDEGLLTRAAYEEIGGVAGALARHAEATLERIGSERLPLVRELFRNLVTAQGTRASRTIDQLASVAEDREAAREVLAALVDARLLTEYEILGATEDAEPEQRVEIIHESLLSAWPRLVRWQTQDADSAQMRDQVRQAAKVWDDKGRPEELLWTGPSYREFFVWRERYPGRLTDTEQAFARAMTELADRRKRRRRVALGALIVVLVVVLGTFAILWRRSDEAQRQTEVARQEAVAEARRAEASRLLALGRLEIDENPTGAVAYSLASLELSDSAAARRFAVEALWKGPTAFSLGAPIDKPAVTEFSPDGQWLVNGGLGGEIAIWSPGGGEPRIIQAHEGAVYSIDFAPDSEFFVTSGADHSVRVWSVREGRLLGTIDDLGSTVLSHHLVELTAEGDRLFAFTFRPPEQAIVRIWSLEDGELQGLGSSEVPVPVPGVRPKVDPSGRMLLFAEDRELRILEIDRMEDASPRVVGSHESQIATIGPFLGSGRLQSTDREGEIRVWDLESGSRTPLRSIDLPGSHYGETVLGPSGTWLGARRTSGTVRVTLWRTDGPTDAEPLVLRQPVGTMQVNDLSFDPTGSWVALTDYTGVTLWPLAKAYPSVLVNRSGQSHGIAIAPDGRWVAGVASSTNGLYVFPIDASRAGWARPVGRSLYGLPAAHPDSKHIAVGSGAPPGHVYLAPVGPEGEVEVFEGFTSTSAAVAVSPDARWIAAGGGLQKPEEGVVRVWDAETTEEIRVLDPGEHVAITSVSFLPDGRLVAASGKGARVWNVETGTSRIIARWQAELGFAWPSGDGRRLVLYGANLQTGNTGLKLHDLESGETRPIEGFGSGLVATLDRRGDRVASADAVGVVRVGPVDGGEPHLLLGHQGFSWGAHFTPDDRHVVSVDDGGTVRVWEAPEGRPFHTLPREELLRRLRALTNFRVVGDGEGYRLEAEPFRGWAEVPTW